jgi:hypothetical protein
MNEISNANAHFNHFDQHTLYAEINDATYEQLQYVLHTIIQKLNKVCKYYINIVESKTGFRCAYIYVTNKHVYYAIIGKNFDGSERIKYVDDPDFVEPEIPLDEALELYYKRDLSSCFNWADDTEQFEDIQNKYICPKIKISEPVLIEIPNYNLGCSIEFGPAYVKPVPKNYKHNVLVCFSIPKWITVENLKYHFAKFNTYKVPSDSIEKKKYPIISIKHGPNPKGGNARITYHHSTNDSHFALIFSKYVTITNKNNTESQLCKFWYLKDNSYTGSK